MTDNPWTALLAKLEVATEGSRDIDMEIHYHVTGGVTGAYGPHPHYTESLDAIVAVVKAEGCWWVLNSGLSRHGIAKAIIAKNGDSTNQFEANAPTPALAMRIAFCRYKEATWNQKSD